MVVPAEHSDRTRSASLGSLRYEDFMTMEPADRYSAPRRAPPPPAIPDFLGPRYRLPTAHASSSKSQASERTPSPGVPSWWSPRKLFGRKHSTSSIQSTKTSASDTSFSEERRNSMTSSSSQPSPSRCMSPESLRRFLCDERPRTPDCVAAERLSLSIPDDSTEEDDDDNFTLASAASDYGPKTILSPPPPVSSSSDRRRMARHQDGGSVDTLATIRQATSFSRPRPLATSYTFAACLAHDRQAQPISRFSFSSDECSVLDRDSVDPLDTSAHAGEIPSFYHTDDEDDDDTECLSPPIHFNAKRGGLNMGRKSLELSLAKAFEGYRLPADGMGKLASAAAQDGEASVVSSPPLLALPVMDDFTKDLKSAGLI